MTVRIQIILTDNLDEQHGEVTDIGPDGETVVISKNGVVRELHLTKAHSGELDALMDPYLAAGHQPGAQPEMPQLPGRDETRRERLKGQGRRREIPGTRDFYRELREWAPGAGLKIRQAGRAGSRTTCTTTCCRTTSRTWRPPPPRAGTAVSPQPGWTWPGCSACCPRNTPGPRRLAGLSIML